MFQLRPVERETWQILNANDEPVFTGSLRQCEDWLDHQENLSRPHRRPFSALASRVRAAFSGASVRAAGPVAAADKCVPRR